MYKYCILLCLLTSCTTSSIKTGPPMPPNYSGQASVPKVKVNVLAPVSYTNIIKIPFDIINTNGGYYTNVSYGIEATTDLSLPNSWSNVFSLGYLNGSNSLVYTNIYITTNPLPVMFFRGVMDIK